MDICNFTSISDNDYTGIQANSNINYQQFVIPCGDPYGFYDPNNIQHQITNPLDPNQIPWMQPIQQYPYDPNQIPYYNPWNSTTPSLMQLKIFNQFYYFNYDVTPYIPYVSLINLFGAKMYDELILQGVIFPDDMHAIILSKIPMLRRDEKIEEILKEKKS